MTSRCCVPLSLKRLPVSPYDAMLPRGTICDSMIEISAGAYRMGSEDSDVFSEDGEGPVRVVELPAFMIDAFAVSNEVFGKFVASTGYRTDAERYGWSFVFVAFVTPQAEVLNGRVHSAPWWLPVRGLTGVAPGDRARTSTRLPTIPSYMCLGTTRFHSRGGVANGFPPRPSGKWQRVVG